MSSFLLLLLSAALPCRALTFIYLSLAAAEELGRRVKNGEQTNQEWAGPSPLQGFQDFLFLPTSSVGQSVSSPCAKAELDWRRRRRGHPSSRYVSRQYGICERVLLASCRHHQQ